ncbi:MAG: class I SAM-dependent methyltransferase [Gemmatimonadales bacterium]|nr:MAG: class I SAM-dependent methyltransferase [Gemmatimonadales bacterium]
MTCGHCQLADREFGVKSARRDMARYRKRGPDATTRGLIGTIRGQSIASATLLDVGSGIGVLTQELLNGLVTSATLVDESTAYQAVARELAAEHGTSDRCTFVQGDFVDVQPSLPGADLVSLDRVICCYPEVARLLGAVADTGAMWCGLSYPRDRWFIKAMVAVMDASLWLQRMDFRVFVHPERRTWALLEKEGFRVHVERGTFVWKVVLLKRRTDCN